MAAARVMPGVWGVLASSSPARTIRMPWVFQSSMRLLEHDFIVARLHHNRPKGQKIMPLDPQCKAFLDQLAATPGPPLHEMTVEQARSMPLWDFGVPVEEVARVENRSVPGPSGPIPIRIYAPVEGRVPALMYFHGGGWVIGDLNSHDRECRTLANQSGCAVIAVD